MSALLITTFAFAQKIQEKDVPAAVKTKFTSMFPTAKVEKWEKEDGKFEAEFDNSGTETSVMFEANGPSGCNRLEGLWVCNPIGERLI